MTSRILERVAAVLLVLLILAVLGGGAAAWLWVLRTLIRCAHA